MIIQEVTVKDRKKYYSEYFPVDLLLEVIGLAEFNSREFGFLLENGSFVRNLSFETPSDLVDYMSQKAVKGAYVGAIYQFPPTPSRPIQRLTWKSREFVFDIDMDEYGSARTCGCEGAQVCPVCWSLMNDAMLFLSDTMKKDFSIPALYWLFSGRRGVHGWMPSDLLTQLSQEQRSAIIGYLTMIHDTKGATSVDDLPTHAVLLRDRILTLLAPSYYASVTVKYLRTFGFKKKEAEYAIARASTIVKERAYYPRFFVDVTPSNLQSTMLKEIIFRRYPRIDKKVTMDTRRVMRIPGSIHDKTNYLCHFIQDPWTFTLDQAITVHEVLEETVDLSSHPPTNALDLLPF